jgi:hypothetical protein
MNFKVIKRVQDANGRHETHLIADNGDEVVIKSASDFVSDFVSLSLSAQEQKAEEAAPKKAKSAK